MSGPYVLDARRRSSRFCFNCWERWENQQDRTVRLVAALGCRLNRWILQRRVAGRASPPERPFILSVGNLRLGGTGKTPVVIQLASELGQRGFVGVVLTRGYGSAAAGPLRVDPATTEAGDEARVMAAQLVDWIIWQARDRAAGLRAALAADPDTAVVILEDGFQTAGIPRHLDMVILDRWHNENGLIIPQTGLPLPWGPYREDATGAQRAAVWLVETKEPITDKLRGRASNGPVPVIPFRRIVSLPTESAAGRAGPFATVAGIANPTHFEQMCTDLLGRQPEVAARFDDHVKYSAGQVADLLAAGAAHGIRHWLTTAKDHIKLVELWPADIPLWPVSLTLEWSGTETLPDLVEERYLKNTSGRV
ncbi:MAG: tetraacyldisaccharide 4'-kinase [bacterium]